MKIIFFGSSEFAVPSVKRLLDSQYEVLAVVTQPDRERGRRLKVQATPVKNALKGSDIPLYQPERMDDQQVVKGLKSHSADLFIIVAFGQILPSEILEIPRLYCINLHPSLLPNYRGAAPVNWAVINGESKTGLTVIRMNEKMDSGDIIIQRDVGIEGDDTADSLEGRLSELGSVLLLDTVKFIEEGRAKFKKQDEKKATFAPKLKKEDGLIDWSKTAREIHQRVRGTIPWPGAYTHYGDKKINIWKTSVIEGEGAPGEVVSAEENIIVGSKKELLRLDEVQLEGKKRMGSSEFLRGFRQLMKGGKFGV